MGNYLADILGTGAGADHPFLINPDGATLTYGDMLAGSARIAQDASIYLLKLLPGNQAQHTLTADRGMWLHIAKGSISVNGIELIAGDAVSLEEPGEIKISATAGASEAILFDLK